MILHYLTLYNLIKTVVQKNSKIFCIRIILTVFIFKIVHITQGQRKNVNDKRYFVIYQQITRYLVHSSECLCHTLPFFATQIIIPFLTLRVGILANWKILNVPLV